MQSLQQIFLNVGVPLSICFKCMASSYPGKKDANEYRHVLAPLSVVNCTHSMCNMPTI